jgi:hypothetical protein
MAETILRLAGLMMTGPGTYDGRISKADGSHQEADAVGTLNHMREHEQDYDDKRHTH